MHIGTCWQVKKLPSNEDLDVVANEVFRRKIIMIFVSTSVSLHAVTYGISKIKNRYAVEFLLYSKSRVY